MESLWQLAVIAGPVPWIVFAIAAALLLIILIRPLTQRRLLADGIAVAVGAAVGFGVFLLSNLTDVFGGPQPLGAGIWIAATLAAIGLAIASLADSSVWRKVVAAFAIVWFLVTALIGVNAVYGLDPTLGSIFGIVSGDPIDIPTPNPGPSQTGGGPLYESWIAPAGMPATGKQGTEAIPGTVSGFAAREAGIYLPPAAQVPNAPALPLVIMMMGYPGNPDPSYIGGVLDAMAAEHSGLAPIVIVADQIGTGDDPACADSSALGAAETYIKTDVVDWAKRNLNIIQDPRYWVIAGYSNGGGCAIKYGAQEPDVFKNILDVSGEEFPGSEDVSGAVAQIYGGDQAAFEASKPVNIMAANPGAYAGVTAVFTAGGEDPEYKAAAQTVSDAAAAAGMTVTNYVVPGAGHVGEALPLGLKKGFTVLYPVLGLSAP